MSEGYEVEKREYFHDFNEWMKKIELLRDSMDVTSQPFIVGYPDGRLITFNNAYCELTGYTREELLNSNWYYILTPSEWREKEKFHFEELHRTGKPLRYEKEYIRKDGTRIPVEVFRHLATDSTGNALFYYSFITNITKRKQSEYLIKVSAVNLARAEKLASIGYWDWDLITNEVKWSDGHFRIFGYPIEHGTETYDMFRDRVHPDDIDDVERAVRKGIERDIEYNWDYRLVRPDGSIRYVHAEAVKPIKDASGRPVRLFGIVQDVTEHKRAEEALRKSESSLTEAQHIGSIGSWEWNIQTGELIWSAELYSIYGLDPNTIKPTISSFTDYVHPDDREYVNRMIDQIVYKGIPFNFDFRIVSADGSVHYLNTRGEIKDYDENGKPRLMVGVNQDITERKQAEKVKEQLLSHIKAQSEQMEAVFSTIEEAVVVYDLKGRPIKANPGAYHIFGFDPVGNCKRVHTGRESLKYLDGRLVPREDFPLVRALAGQVVKGERYIYTNGDGQELIVDASVAPLYEGDCLRGAVGIWHDMTKYRRAEEALRESEAKYRTIVETAGEGIIIARPDGPYFFVNQRFADMLGYTVDEVLGKSSVDFIFDSCVHRVFQARTDLHRNQRIESEFKFRRKDGSELWTMYNATPMYNDKSEHIANFAMHTDITGLKRAEVELRTAKAQAELYLDIMGHDINNMHQIALGYLEMSKDMPPGTMKDEMIEKSIEVLQRSANLIQNVRKLQKLKEGIFQKKEIDVCQVLEDVQREFGSVPRKSVRLNLNKCEHCCIRANELLHDVFANLVSNAIKHTGDYADITIDVNTLKDDNNQYCQVVVEDTGQGIPDELKDEIFQRISNSTAKTKGMGLGLYLVKSLVESYDGKVWVENRVPGDHSKGAKFVVMLPSIK